MKAIDIIIALKKINPNMDVIMSIMSPDGTPAFASVAEINIIKTEAGLKYAVMEPETVNNTQNLN